jgi:uncharacterized membrane protein YkoI
MRVFVVLAMLLSSLSVTAGPHASADTMSPEFVLAQRGPQNLLPGQNSARVGTKQAASRVKQKYQDRKILSINLIQSRGPAVYRVKTLSSRGVVKYVFVDGNSGDVFE